MQQDIFARLVWLANEIRPSLPPQALLVQVGKMPAVLIRAVAEHGLGGARYALEGGEEVTFSQLCAIYEQGGDLGADGSEQEFRTCIAGEICLAIQDNRSISPLERMRLIGQVDQWYKSTSGMTETQILDWDAEPPRPLFRKTGFAPLDQALGGDIPQEVITILGKPGDGKTTLLLALAIAWRRAGHGRVSMFQIEMPPAAIAHKLKGMYREEERLFKDAGVNKIHYGSELLLPGLEALATELSDPDQLILVDSVSGFCGGGDTNQQREMYHTVYQAMNRAKNRNAAVVCCSHVKRGVGKDVDLEDGAGSAAIERYSGVVLQLRRSAVQEAPGPQSCTLWVPKHRYRYIGQPHQFLFDFKTGESAEGQQEEFV